MVTYKLLLRNKCLAK